MFSDDLEGMASMDCKPLMGRILLCITYICSKHAANQVADDMQTKLGNIRKATCYQSYLPC